jgi:ketosteroid isomerase-like protein
MCKDEQAVSDAVRFFYLAIEDMVDGRGLEKMEQAWHQNERVTTKHPMSDWAVGWEEVLTTWQIANTFGKPGRGGSKLLDLKVHLYGDVAYTTCVFHSSPEWGNEKLMCTNVLHKVDGMWKLVHHHADNSPGMMAALERMIAAS